MKRTIKITSTFDITRDRMDIDEVIHDLKKEFEACFGGLEEFKGSKVDVVYEDD